MTLKLRPVYFILVFAIVVYACASYGTLTGGKKDITPPVLEKCTPPNYSTNFNGKKIQMSFDEFIQLKELQKYFVVSPPMKTAPLVTQKPKDVIVTFEDEFLPNTTYSLQFGNSIVDNNEGNPFQKFEFVFSTGDHIDSLSLLGKIYNAFDHAVDKDGMFVMLYKLTHDSIPRKTRPAYISKSDDKGWFFLNHINPDTFMIFGLKDLNRNYMFDLPTENIAFSDTLIVFDSTYYVLKDTIPVTKLTVKDTANFDSTDYFAGKTPKIELYYFTEDHKKQYLNNYSRPQRNNFNLFFELPADSFQMELLDTTFHSKNWLLKDNNIINDTLHYWITDTSLVQKDTIQLRIGYQTPDSAGKLYLHNDTIKLIMKLNPAQKRKKEKEHWLPVTTKVRSSLGGNPTLDLNQKFFIEPDQPAQLIDISKLTLSRMEDSLFYPVKFTVQRDSLYPQRYFLKFDYESDTEYALICDSGAFNTIYDMPNDSTGFKFKTQREDFYGLIKLTLKNTEGPTVVQLTSSKGDLIRQKFVEADGDITFDYLPQGNYSFKLIYDRNRNGVWDTGNWEKRLQPERTVYYKGEINVRQNWDKEIIWELPVFK